MKKKVLINIIAAVLSLIVVGTIITFAWYINTKKTSPVEISTNGISISYAINSDTAVNQETFDVENISFFDIESESEAYYLPSMAVCLKLTITNYSTTAVDITLEQDTQGYTLGTEIAAGVISVYRYTKASVNKTIFEGAAANTYYTYDNVLKTYTAPLAFKSGTTYYTREKLFDATPTIANSKVSAVALSNALGSYVTVLDRDGSAFAVEEYVEVENLSLDDFNQPGAEYYTLASSTYTLAKTYDANATYYEKKTVAYLSDFTISAGAVTACGYAVSGSYVSCVISDVSKLTYISQTNEYKLPAVAQANKYQTSVESYLSTNTLTHKYETATKLTAGSYGTSGGSIVLYAYIYGVQPYAGATNNFLNNGNNEYPLVLNLKAE